MDDFAEESPCLQILVESPGHCIELLHSSIKMMSRSIFARLPQTSSTEQFSSPLMKVLWKVMMVAGVVIYGSHAILINLCKNDQGKIPFSSASVVLLSEVIKFLFSVILLLPEMWRGTVHYPPIKTVVFFSIPAFLYCISNNTAVHVQVYLDPASFQVLCNFKTGITAILYWFIIRRNISEKQWTALGLITLAGCFNSYGGLQTSQDIIQVRNNSTNVARHVYVTVTGLLLMVFYCTMSGLAGISTEYILKRQYKISLHLQNTLMYFYGMMFNLLAYCTSDSQPSDSSAGFFSGYSKWTVVIVFCQAMNGLILSAVMKHSSNLIRLLIIACAMIVNTALSMAIFSLQLNLYFNVAFILVILALKLYHS